MSNLDENVPSRGPDEPGDTAFTPTIDVLHTQLVNPPMVFNDIPAAPKQRRHGHIKRKPQSWFPGFTAHSRWTTLWVLWDERVLGDGLYHGSESGDCWIHLTKYQKDDVIRQTVAIIQQLQSIPIPTPAAGPLGGGPLSWQILHRQRRRSIQFRIWDGSLV